MNRQPPRPVAPRRAAHAIETLVWASRDDADRDTAHAHQARISAFLNGPGREVIARVFTRMSADHEVWQLDTLEIDTGRLSAHGSFAEWAAILERQLSEALWRARQSMASGASHAVNAQAGDGMLTAGAATGDAPRPSDPQRLEHFLFYLQHGYLPWSRSAIAGRGLSAWLAVLARRTGPRLWSLLRELRPTHYVLSRLSQITPYQGLQALVAVRHRELAASLDALDAQLLVPLQARGRLSIYQVQQLQQAWRLAAFRTMWNQRGAHLSIDDIQRLQRELGTALALQLGQGGLGAWRPARLRMGGRRPDASGDDIASALELRLLLGVVDVVAPRRRMRALEAQRDDVARRAAPAGRMAARQVGQDVALRARQPLDAALDRLARALDGSEPLDVGSIELLLRELARREPVALRTYLRALVLRQGEGTANWIRRHGAAVVAQVLGVLATGGAAASGAVSATRPRAPLGTHWAESLRQFALAALAQGAMPGGTRPGGLSALQAWLAAFSLRQLALGERPPATRQDWERLWQRAMVAWQHGGASGRGRSPRGVRARADVLQPEIHAPDDLVAPTARRALPLSAALRETLARRVRRRNWRWQVATHWDAPRKVGLLALIDMAHGRAGAQPWPEATRRWQWVADAVATCIAQLDPDAETDARAWHWHAAWLWEVAIRRAWRDTGSLNAVSLLQAWSEAAVRGSDRPAPLAVSPAATVPAVVAALRHLGRPLRRLGARVLRRGMPAGNLPPVRAPVTMQGFSKRADAGMPCRWHAVHRVTARAERLAHILALPRQRATVRDAGVRQQVRQWMADPALCADWLGATRPAQRWTLLGVLYPRQVATLRRCSDGLQRVASALVPHQGVAARRASHWRFLADHVFVRALPVTPGWLVRRHALSIRCEAGEYRGAGGTRLERWFSHVADIVGAWGRRPAATTPQSASAPVSTAGRGIPAWFRAAGRALRRAPDAAEAQESIHLAQRQTRNPDDASARPSHPVPAAANRADIATADDAPELAALARSGPFDTYYVDAAGLVLLATYCQRLFDRLGLLEDRRLRDAAAVSHAVRCLAWLVHGHDDASEPECVLQKLLCGMRLTEPLAADTALDAPTRELLDGLLQAVIANWEALGNTSPAGLRQAFLQREGRLMREQSDAGFHWRLVVKPGPFDMLLDRLPWAYATIKLPWMEEVLYVDWR
jgi:hypothetical protein